MFVPSFLVIHLGLISLPVVMEVLGIHDVWWYINTLGNIVKRTYSSSYRALRGLTSSAGIHCCRMQFDTSVLPLDCSAIVFHSC
jgi:hypothetical protein